MTAKLAEEDIKKLLSSTAPFMNHVHLVRESFNLLPDKVHFGACINYVDLQEYREEFLQELINTVLDWVYSQDKARGIMERLRQDGRSESNAQTALFQQAKRKFRSPDTRYLHLQGQFGELLLFNFLQYLFHAVPLLRKMPITTSIAMERNGADAIHYAMKEGIHLLFLGESKTYTADYQFGVAFRAALESILNTFQNHRHELDQYIYEGFLDDNLQGIAEAYKNGSLKNVEVHMVTTIVYNETSDLAKKTEAQIKEDIVQIIRDKSSKLDKSIFRGIDPNLLPRLNYIIMPVWELDNLVRIFQEKLGI